jgi:hypothetical protein
MTVLPPLVSENMIGDISYIDIFILVTIIYLIFLTYHYYHHCLHTYIYLFINYLYIIVLFLIGGIGIYGYDISDSPRDVYIRIIQIPSKGSLYNTNMSTKSLNNNEKLSTIILKNNHKELKVFYKGYRYFFTTPVSTWNGSVLSPSLIQYDTFVFSAFTLDGSKSLNVSQEVSVQNVNDPTLFDISGLKSSSPNVSNY